MTRLAVPGKCGAFGVSGDASAAAVAEHRRKMLEPSRRERKYIAAIHIHPVSKIRFLR